MFDLEVIRHMNEEAHLKSVQRSQEESLRQQSPVMIRPVYPLSDLARCLTAGPPSISHILELFLDTDTVLAFNDLLREYLPEHEEEIRLADVDTRIRLFAHYFGERYFPLSDTSVDYELGDFVGEIPVDLMGFNSEDYHEFTDFRTGFIVLLSLIESPYVDFEHDQGGRVPILSYIADQLGTDVAALIPKAGFSLEQMHHATDGTKFNGAGSFADWVHSCTNCWQLDASYEEYSGETWKREIVSGLTEQWPQVQDIWERINKVTSYIEENPKKRLMELLQLLLGPDVNVSQAIIPKEQLPLPLFNEGKIKIT